MGPTTSSKKESCSPHTPRSPLMNPCFEDGPSADNSPSFGRKETLLVISQCSQALQHVHGRNYFHFDVKPRNILIWTWDPVNIVLADWADMKPRLYLGKAPGIMAFWPPDVANGGISIGVSDDICDDICDDIWALGVSILGMIVLWPRLETQKYIRQYPKVCSSHAQKLLELNPTEKVIHMLNRMLTEYLELGATSSQYVDLADAALREVDAGDVDDALAMVTQPNFNPISFWLWGGLE